MDDVSFTIRRGETFGLVGESGCGKSTLGRSILRLERPQSGQILFEGEDLLTLPPARLKQVRRNIQAIFQDPFGSLDPRMTVRQIIAEGLIVQGLLRRDERDDRIEQLIDVVGLRREHLGRYPHEFSGGQRQRIGIARALALRPKFVLADEPVSALDVSVQSQVLNLLIRPAARVRPDLPVHRARSRRWWSIISDRVGVMYLGRLVEVASAERSTTTRACPTRGRCCRRRRAASGRPGASGSCSTGDVPSPLDPPSGCPFRTRCWLAEEVCAAERPALREVAPEHFAACHFADDPERLAAMPA